MRRGRLLGAIAQGTITREAAAKDAGVSCRTINRWMIAYGVKRPPSARARKKDKAALIRKARKQVILATRGEEAKVPAALLSLSVRTINRLRSLYLEDSDGSG